jgi:hypothetical protein
MRTEDVPTLTDDYAPVVNLLNPVTEAPYEGGEAIRLRNSLNPLIIAGLWILALVSVYLASSVTLKEFGSGYGAARTQSGPDTG